MAQPTNIEWTEQSWNFLRGCRRVSEGCRNCYAERQAIRHSGPGEPYHGLVQSTPQGPRWTGELSFHEHILLAPLKRKKPTTYFVNSMSDLFYEKVTAEMLDKAFAVMALTPQHTYQILTKRPERMLEYMAKISDPGYFGPTLSEYEWCWLNGEVRDFAVTLPNSSKHIWLGVSVEDQKTADERIPLLLRTPAAVRWISAEPLIGPVDLNATPPSPGAMPVNGSTYDDITGCLPKWQSYPMRAKLCGGLDWVVVGGESGPGARSCNIEWIRSIVGQCKSASVPVFVKQLGANIRSRNDTGFEGDCPRSWPMDTDYEEHPNGYRQDYQGDPVRVRLNSPKGGDPLEWPQDLRIREFPG